MPLDDTEAPPPVLADPQTAAQDRARAVYQGMLDRGMDAPTALGWAANAMVESKADPAGPRSSTGAAGTFQWVGPRLTAYRALHGHEPEEGDLDEHLDHVVWENQNIEQPAWQAIQRAPKDPIAKAIAIRTAWERPGRSPEEKVAEEGLAANAARSLLGFIGTARAENVSRPTPAPAAPASPVAPPDLAKSVAAARKAGYDDAAIFGAISSSPRWGGRVAAALKAGHPPESVAGFMGLNLSKSAPAQGAIDQGTWDAGVEPPPVQAPGQSAQSDAGPNPLTPPVRSGRRGARRAESDQDWTDEELAAQRAARGPDFPELGVEQPPAPRTPRVDEWGNSIEGVEIPPAGGQSYPAALMAAGNRGVVTGTGQAISGAGEAYQSGQIRGTQNLLAAMDLVDQGDIAGAMKPLTPVERGALAPYIRANPDRRAALRIEQQNALGDLVERNPNMVTRAGQAVSQYGQERFPVSPENEGFGTKVAETIGGVVPMIGAGIAGGTVAGPAGAIGATLPIIGAQSFSATRAEALKAGASPEEAERDAGISALTQMGIMATPVGRVVRSVPDVAAPLAQALVELGKRGAEFGTFAAMSKFADNFVARQTFDPQRNLMEGVPEAAATGLAAGAVMGVPSVLRGRQAAPGVVPPEEMPPVTPVGQPSLPGPAGGAGTAPPEVPPRQPVPPEAAQPMSDLQDIAAGRPAEGALPTLEKMAARARAGMPAVEPAAEPSAVEPIPAQAVEPASGAIITPPPEVPLALPAPESPRARGRQPEPGGAPIALGGPEPEPAPPTPPPAPRVSRTPRPATPTPFLPEQEPLRLTDFIRSEGGVQDPGGDVRSMLGGAKYRPGLVNHSGRSLRDMMVRAWESGYFPGHSEEPPRDDRVLLETLNEDLSGNPVYSHHDDVSVSNYERAKQHNAEVARLAWDTGIPTEGKTHEQFYNAVAEHMSVEDLAREIGQREADHQSAFDAAEKAAQSAGLTPVDIYGGAPRSLEDIEREYQQEHAATPASESQGGSGQPVPASAGAQPVQEGAGQRGRGPGAGGGAGQTDLLGQPIRTPATRPEPEPTVKNDVRQTLIPGTGPSAVQAQAAQDQKGRGALLPTVEQAKPDEGLFAKPEVEQPSLTDHAASQAVEPTPAQAEAGNYQKGHVTIGGLDIAIETPKGGVRRGVGANGQPWSVEMPAHYGYVKRTEGADGDHLDVSLGPQADTAPDHPVVVIDQIDPRTGQFDEHKGFLGFATPRDAIAAYDASFSDGSGPARRGAVASMPFDQFKQWATSGDLKAPVSAQPGPADHERWWDKELTTPGRQAMLNRVGMGKRVPKIKWKYLKDDERAKLLAMRGKLDAAGQDERGLTKEPTWKVIGKNADGVDVWEDRNGVRSYVRDGMRVTEKVQIIPGKGQSVAEPASKEPEFQVAKEGKPEAPANDITPLSGALPGYDAAGNLVNPDQVLADILANSLDDPNHKLTSRGIQKAAEGIYGGTLGSGALSRDRLYDAIELGANTFIQRHPEQFSPVVDETQAKTAATKLAALKERLPTQTVRAGEKDTHQQFSTPPDYAYAANWVANLRPSDRVLEPSAGTGGLLVHAMNAGVFEAYANELSDKRRSMVGTLKPTSVHGEDATQLHNILPENIRPTAVVMNPPFSVAAGRMGNKMVLGEGARHVEQALARLEPGGRLVAIVGRGMAPDAPTFRDWWKKIAAQYDVRANLGVDGDIYRKYGTTFPTRILVIDKVAPSGRPLVTGEVKTAGQIIDALKGIRDERPEISGGTVEPMAGEPAGGGVASQSERTGRPGNVSVGTTGVGGTGERVGDGEGAVEPGPTVSGGRGAGSVATVGKRPTAGGTRDEVATQQPQSGPGGTATKPAGGAGESENATGSGASSRRGGIRPDGSGERDVPGVTSPSELVAATEKAVTDPHDEALTESVYETYKPQRIKVAGAKAHPGALVQSAAMASVQPPMTDYKPRLPPELIKTGGLSDAQLEAIVYAGNAHSQMLPAQGEEVARRRGFFVGDGTGVGKGREIAGIILDNWNHGRKKALWVSEKKPLINDAKRDWSGLGQQANAIIDHGKVKASDKITAATGILFTSYDTLKSEEKAPKDSTVKPKTRVDQIVEWLGKDFDGVIAFDEAHNLGNSTDTKGTRGVKKAAAKAIAGVELQQKLPNARVVYVSATGATEVNNLAYADRLGLWGRGTAFANRNDFLAKVSSGGIAAMELVARDMKALGHYVARNLSYDGVEYNRLEHKLNADQRATYDKMAEGWQLVLRNIEKALELTATTEGGKVDGKAKSAAMSAFWGSHQRFFNQIITSMQMPSVIKGVEQDIKEGRQAVLQLVNTMEAAQGRAVEKARANEQEDLEDLDMTPRDQLMQMIEHSFPVAQMEEYQDENGNARMRPVVDRAGNPVLNKEAVAMRDRLLDQLGSLRVPDGPLEILLNHFGTDKVAEVTGRKQRVVKKVDDKGNMKSVLEKREGQANVAEANLFQDGKKPILVFSEAGGTGRSYHADINSGSAKARRSHYLVQAGWRADKAVQGFGRTHRTNQASAPVFHLVTTDLDGQKRFISSIARRLAQLGALTKGERRTGDQGMFGLKDNLESDEAKGALRQFFQDAARGAIEGITIPDLERGMGLKLRDPETGALRQDLPPMPQFLNRLLSLKINDQNATFQAFAERLDQAIDRAAAAGTLDTGVETYKADKITKKSDNIVYTDPQSGAETRHVQLEISDRNNPVSFDDTLAGRNRTGGKPPVAWVKNKQSGRVFAVSEATAFTDPKSGAIVDQYRLTSPLSYQFIDRSKIGRDNWVRVSDIAEAREAWEKQVAATPPFRKSDLHLITGAVLPIWDRLGGNPKIFRLQTSDGERMLGRVVPDDMIDRTLEALGAESRKVSATPAEVIERVMNGGSAHLANGWTIKRSLVAGEQRLELTGPNYTYDAQLKNDGVFTERINYQTRYFIPIGPDAARVVETITQGRPITQVSGGGGDVQFSRTGAAGGMAPLRASLAQSRAGVVRRGAEAMINRLRLQSNMDAARGQGSAIGHDAIREVDDFIRFIGEHMFNDVGLRIMKDGAGANGAFETGRRIVYLFRSAIDAGSVPHTMVHELWHSLERVLPETDRAALTAEFRRQQAKWLKKNEWARPFLESRDLRDSLTGASALAWLKDHSEAGGDQEWTRDPNVARSVQVEGRGTSNPTVHIVWSPENYRFKNRSEYFAETMTDRHFDDQDIQNDKARSVFAHIRDMWRRLVAGIVRLFGRDATGRIYEGFRARDYAPGVDRGLMSGYDVADSRGQRPADDRGTPLYSFPGMLFDPAVWREATKALAPAARPIARAAGSALQAARDVTESIADGLAPMRTGSTRAKAFAADFANALRQSQYRYGEIDREIERNFNPAQREQMGRALDAQSVFEQRVRDLPHTDQIRAREAFDASGEGLASLQPAQRHVIELLDTLSQATWEQMRERGMVAPEARPLPYYFPRQMVMWSEAEGFSRAGGSGSGGGNRGIDGRGSNLSTQGPMRREHLTPEETEAAARGVLGDNARLLRDIRSLPARLAFAQRAIAGVDLMNRIEEVGRDTGVDLVVRGDIPGLLDPADYFTMADHPAFRKWTGTGWQATHVAREFEGPLKAVLTKTSPTWYRAAQGVKSGVMHAIMFSPFIHLAVELGRSLPVDPIGVITLRALRDGSTLRRDLDYMDQAITDGLSPLGRDSWRTDPVTLAEQAAGVDKGPFMRALTGLRDAVANGAGRIGGQMLHDILQHPHQTLLWDQVFNLQVGLYDRLRRKWIADGYSPEVAGTMAAHIANRYAGALPPEHLSKAANMAANLLMFSRSFTLGNLGVMKDMMNGAPGHIRARIEQMAGPETAASAQKVLRRKAMSAFVMDIGLFWLANGLLQAGIQVMRQGIDETERDWMDKAALALQGAATGNPLSIFGVLPQHWNEPGKQERVYAGKDDQGRGIYLRLPPGKVGEEFVGWFTHPGTMMMNKSSPLVRPIIELAIGYDSLGRQQLPPHPETIGDFIDSAGQVVKHIAEGLGPTQFIQGVGEMWRHHISGTPATGDPGVTAMKVIGPLTGLAQVSSGYPGGPAMGELHAQTERERYALHKALPDIRKKIAAGDLEGAVSDMTALHVAPGLQRYYIRNAVNPGTMTRSSARILGTAPPEVRERVDRQMAPP